MTYQDLIDDNGEVTRAGYRECAERYEVIRDFVSDLRRPFTVLDFGAASGYFSVRLTQDFGARCVAVEAGTDIRHAEGRIAAAVQKKANPEDIRQLGTFDVVMGLSVLHHMSEWKRMLTMLNKVCRSRLILETPSAHETLRSAKMRNKLPEILKAIMATGSEAIGFAPSVWDQSIERTIFGLKRNGLPTTGYVFSGSGQNSHHLGKSREDLAEVLGYLPFPGSLNLRTKYAFRLGAYAMEFIDARGKGGRRGGDYQIWHARIDGYDGPVHVFRPGARTHGRYVLEIWAPINLREHLGLEDGSPVTVRIGA